MSTEAPVAVTAVRPPLGEVESGALQEIKGIWIGFLFSTKDLHPDSPAYAEMEKSRTQAIWSVLTSLESSVKARLFVESEEHKSLYDEMMDALMAEMLTDDQLKTHQAVKQHLGIRD